MKPNEGAQGDVSDHVTFSPTAVLKEGTVGNFEPVVKKGSGPGRRTQYSILISLLA